jgi:hypothetical protein
MPGMGTPEATSWELPCFLTSDLSGYVAGVGVIVGVGMLLILLREMGP